MPAVVDSTELTAGPPSHSSDSEAAQVDVAKAKVSLQHQSAASGFGGAVVDTALRFGVVQPIREFKARVQRTLIGDRMLCHLNGSKFLK